MWNHFRRRLLAALLALGAASCGDDLASKPPVEQFASKFRDDARSNAEVADGALDLTLVDRDGKQVDLGQYRGRKHVVLVVTRGFGGSICPYCSAQTSRLISNYPEFAKRDAEVLLVFPGPSQHLTDFMQSLTKYSGTSDVPFPILLDENAVVVERLGIKGNLAKPSTYILDKEGRVRFAYVGTTTTDRPSVKALLQQLDAISKG